MPTQSNFKREKSQQEKFIQLIKAGCFITMAFYLSATGFAISEYLQEMKSLSENMTEINFPERASKNIEIIDVSTGVIRQASAYNSVPEQTDDTPCISADGSNICELLAAGECIIAGNFADLGSQHYIDGIGLCTLHDRMSSRYQENIDIFFGYDIQAAKNFGRQNLLVKSI